VPEPGPELELPKGMAWDADMVAQCTTLLEKDLHTLAYLYARDLSLGCLGPDAVLREILPSAVRWNPAGGGVEGHPQFSLRSNWIPWSNDAMWILGTYWEPRQLLQAIRSTREAIGWCKAEATRQQAAREARHQAEKETRKYRIAAQAEDIRELTSLLVQDALRGEDK